MNALAQNLAAAVSAECNVLSFTGTDHEAKVDRLDAVVGRHMAEASQRIRRTKEDLRSTLATIDADIAALQLKRAETEAGANLMIATDKRIISKCRGFLAAGD